MRRYLQLCKLWHMPQLPYMVIFQNTATQCGKQFFVNYNQTHGLISNFQVAMNSLYVARIFINNFVIVPEKYMLPSSLQNKTITKNTFIGLIQYIIKNTYAHIFYQLNTLMVTTCTLVCRKNIISPHFFFSMV